MICKYLADTGTKIPAISQGTTGTGGYVNYNPEAIRKRIAVLRYGIDLGMCYLDTADLYGGGLGEEITGQAIRGIRDKVFVASKFNPKEGGFSSIEKSLVGSLRRLKADYIDLYQIHWPNPLMPVSKTMEALSRLTDQGKIRYIGLSNFTVEEFKEAQSFLPKGKIVSNQLEYNLANRSVEGGFLPFCEENKVTLIAYSPLYQGRMFLCEEQKVLIEGLSAKYNKSVPQLILRWIISHNSVIAVTKSRSVKHTEENALSADFTLEEEDIQRIAALSKPECIKVSTYKIRLNINESPMVYTSEEEALTNKLDLIPSPIIVAKLILKRNAMAPIRLVPTRDSSGRYDYDIDSYDMTDNVKKYWGWVIAHGYEAEIPALILQ